MAMTVRGGRYSTVMKRGANLRLVLSAAAGLLVSAGAANAFSWDATKEQQALQLVKEFQARHKVPSVAVSITVDGNIVFATGIDADGSIRPEQQVRFRVGSLTKQFTAATILALIEDKAIVPSSHTPFALDTPLSAMFPSVDPRSGEGKVTVQRLLTMTSNIPSYTEDPRVYKANTAGVAPASQSVEQQQIVRLLKGYHMAGRPQAFQYSNTNYFLLALMVQVLKSGYQPTDTPVTHNYMRERILAKAGMELSGFDEEPTPQGATDAPPHYRRPPLVNQGHWPQGAGDLISTAADIARWNVALMSGKIINEASLRTMFTPASPMAESGVYRGCRYAMGWYACDAPQYRFFQHDGVISGFMASNVIGRQNSGSWMSATVMGNIDADRGISTLARDLLRAGN